MKKYYIVPDVHGRTFWKSVKDINDPDCEIIFLGDYLDPYPHEGITPRQAVDNFREIVDFANKHENVTLLIGNHDFQYFFPKYRCCRHIYDLEEEAILIYKSYVRDWKVVKYIEENNTLLSHAGICIDWWEICRQAYPEIMNYEDLNDFFRSQYDDSEEDPHPSFYFLDMMTMCTYLRGGIYNSASPLWLDIRDTQDLSIPQINQYVGHTGVEKPVMVKKGQYMSIYDLDVMRVFLLDETGIHNYDGSEIEDIVAYDFSPMNI